MKRTLSAFLGSIVVAVLVFAAIPSRAALKDLPSPEYIVNVFANITLGEHQSAYDVLGTQTDVLDVSKKIGSIAFIWRYQKQDMWVDVYTTKQYGGEVFAVEMYILPKDSADVARLQNALIAYIKQNLDIPTSSIHGRMGWVFHTGKYPHVFFTERLKLNVSSILTMNGRRYSTRGKNVDALKIVQCWQKDAMKFVER